MRIPRSLFSMAMLCLVLSSSIGGCGDDEPEAKGIKDVASSTGSVDAIGELPSVSDKCTSDESCQAWGKVCHLSDGVCVQCLSAKECKQGEICTDSSCVPATCEAGVKICKDLATAAVCEPGGDQWKLEVCGDKRVCVAGSCVEIICEAGSSICNSSGDAVLRCSDRGEAQKTLACPDGMSCVAGSCEPQICKPGKTACGEASGTLLTCKESGQGWTEESCKSGESCDSGYSKGVAASCHVQLCKPGDGFCVAGKAMVCSDNGLQVVEVDNCNLNSPTGQVQTCVAGACLPLKCSPSSLACLSWVTLGKCASDGQSWIKKSCGDKMICEGGKCVAQLCAAGEGFCEAGVAKLCNTLGTKAVTVEDCGVQKLDCVEGKCGKVICVPNAVSCSEDKSALITCNGTGQSQTSKNCPKGQYCVGAKCVTTVCAPGELVCKKGAPFKCDAKGAELSPLAPCGANQACIAGVCVKKTCNPESAKCDGLGAFLTCNTNGVGWVPTSCPPKHVCEKGKCVKQVCTPGSSWCEAGIAKTCEVTGMGLANTVDCVKAGKSCVKGICVSKGCGDQQCSAELGETCLTCPKDCGLCAPDGCEALPTAGCQGCKCEACVCQYDTSCCDQVWSGFCATLCETACGSTCK